MKKHPALLFPAYDMQRKLQKFTLGQSYWKRLADKRLMLSNGQFVPIKRFMELHLDKLIKEDKTKYQTERMLSYAKSTTAKADTGASEKNKSSNKEQQDSVNNSSASQEGFPDRLPRRMSSVNGETPASTKESSNKSTRSTRKLTAVFDKHHNAHDITDISAITDQDESSPEWVSASKTSRGAGSSSKKRGTNALGGSDKLHAHVKDKNPQYYRGDALNEALRMR